MQPHATTEELKKKGFTLKGKNIKEAICIQFERWKVRFKSTFFSEF